MITRQDYLNGKATHREYYGQFVNESVKSKVLKTIGKDKLLASTDEHLNDIPMKKWDSIAGFLWQAQGGQLIAVIKPRTSEDVEPIHARLLKEAGDNVSCAGLVCIYKEAAKQIIEDLKSERDDMLESNMTLEEKLEAITN